MRNIERNINIQKHNGNDDSNTKFIKTSKWYMYNYPKRWNMNKSTTMESENVLLHLSETFMGKWYDYETVLIEIIKKC